jgi:2-polyprenyl-3-methyl-5-hydroxy-6-metoxy-1,4-benzoquinol methylase
MATNYDNERVIFNRVASKTVVKPINKLTFERYASPRWPHLFPKEKMFALAGDVRGKKILEVGCGDGTESLQLAYCGADVTGIDISDVSIDVAQKRADIHGLAVKFRVENLIEIENLGTECFDIVWCNLILHHLVDSLDAVMKKLFLALKPGGMFISREPIVYARWLKKLRSLFPTDPEDVSPDEQPFRDIEFKIMRKYLPNITIRHYRILARVDCLTNNLFLIRNCARFDNVLLHFPGSKSLAGDVVMWGIKR